MNGLFVYSSLMQPEAMARALRNPAALAFMIEALLLLALACATIRYYGLRRPGWVGFLLLSLIGSLAFSLPLAVLLWARREESPGIERESESVHSEFQ